MNKPIRWCDLREGDLVFTSFVGREKEQFLIIYKGPSADKELFSFYLGGHLHYKIFDKSNCKEWLKANNNILRVVRVKKKHETRTKRSTV